MLPLLPKNGSLSFVSSHLASLNLLSPIHSKLPTLSSSLSVTQPKDDPSQHGGRIRTTPHIDGQYSTYIYIAVPLLPGSLLASFVGELFHRAKALVPTLQRIGDGSELHVSLSRPTYLRAQQREDFKRAVKAVAKSQHP